MTAGHRDVVEDQLERFGLAGLLPIRVFGSDDVAVEAAPRAAPAGARPARAARSGRDARATSATSPTTCAWPAPSARWASASSRRSGRERSAAGRARRRSSPSVAEFVDDLLGAPAAATPAGRVLIARRRARPCPRPRRRRRPEPGALDAAWPGWDAGVSLVIAADGGARHAAAPRLRHRSWSATATRSTRPSSRRSPRQACPIERVDPEKDDSDTELALAAAIESGVDEVTILGGLGGARTRPRPGQRACSCAPGAVGLAVRLYDERAARLSLLTGPAERRAAWRVAARRSRDAAPVGGGATVSRPGAPLPARRRVVARRPVPRPVERPRPRRSPRVTLLGRPASRDRNPCYSPACMSDPRGRRAGPRRGPSRRDRHDPPARRPARPLDRPVLLPEGRHARLHHRGVPVPRPARGLRRGATPTSGA